MVLFCLFQRARVWFPLPTLKETPVYGTVTRGDPVHLLAPPRCGTSPAWARAAGPAGGVPGGHAWLRLAAGSGAGAALGAAVGVSRAPLWAGSAAGGGGRRAGAAARLSGAGRPRRWGEVR